MTVLRPIPRPRRTPRQEFGETVSTVLLLGKGLGQWLPWPSYSPGEFSTCSWNALAWGCIRPLPDMPAPHFSPVYCRP